MLHWWLTRSPYALIALGCIFWIGLEWRGDEADLLIPMSILIGVVLGWIWTEVAKPS